MQTSKTSKTMKTMKQNYFLKAAGVVAILVMASNQVSAQTTPGAAVNVAKQTTNTVKVIDNKGTIKYFQSNNGITQITNTTADVTTTTWQLGGALTANTYIDATGRVFALDGLSLITSAASTNAVTGSKFGDAGTATGYTLLVRDEATGAVQKMAATSLINAGVDESVLTADFSTTPFTTAVITGLATVANRISVFRNGIKLRQTGATPDWILGATTDVGKIKFTTAAGNFYIGDIIEVQWVK